MAIFVCSPECKMVRTAALASRLSQLCSPPPVVAGAGGAVRLSGAGYGFRGRHRVQPWWSGSAGGVSAWSVGPGRGLRKVGERSNCLVPSRGQVRALSELAGGRARLELPSPARWGVGRDPETSAESTCPLVPELWRFSERGCGKNGTRDGSLSCMLPECHDAELSAFCFCF